MYTFTFRTLLLFLGAVYYLSMPASLQAQCVIDSLVPSVPGIYPDTLADAAGCEYYEQNITFFLPRDTTVDVFGSPFTVPFNFFRIDSVTGLPDGMTWSCNLAPNCFYNVADTAQNPDTLGCIQIYGTPTQVGIFAVIVHLTANATVLGTPTDQPATYDTDILVSPCPFVGTCYTYTLDNLCEGATLTMANNIPSNGDTAYSYNWSLTGPNNYSFQTTDEDPVPQVLPEPGAYVLQYDAVIDTFDYTLTGLTIDSVDCDDLLSAGDIYWILTDPTGLELVNTSANPITNGGANLPINTNIGPITLIDTGTYTLEVWDEDPIINDAGCTNNTIGGGAALYFSIPTGIIGTQTLNSGGLYVTIDIAHPVQTLSCRDTLYLDSLPATPEILVMADTTVLCENDSLVLMTMSTDSIQWYLDGQAIIGATGELLTIFEAGVYTVSVLNTSNLCTSVSAPLTISTQSIGAPGIAFDGNLALGIDNPMPGLRYDWYDIDAGFLASGDSIQPGSSGNFFAVATDPVTGCTSVASDTVQAILASLDQLTDWIEAFRIYPNPSQGQFTLEMTLRQSQSVAVQLLDLSGRKVWQQAYGQQYRQFRRSIELPNISEGIYFLQIQLDAGTLHQKLVLR